MIDFLNKEILRIGSYNIHASLFVLIAFVVLILTIAIIVLKKKQGVVPGVAGATPDNRTKISYWQRENLAILLNKQKEEFIETKIQNGEDGSIENSQFIKLIDGFLDYINKESKWDSQKIINNIHEDAIIVLNSIILEESKRQYIAGNANEALLFAHTLDVMNEGDYLFGKTNEWLGDDISETSKHDAMDINEARLFTKLEDALFQFASYMYESDAVRKVGIPSYLDHIVVSDLEDAFADVQNSTSFLNLKDSTYDVLTYAFYTIFGGYVKRQVNPKLQEFFLYDLRCLCSVIDKDLYNYIIQTIE